MDCGVLASLSLDARYTMDFAKSWLHLQAARKANGVVFSAKMSDVRDFKLAMVNGFISWRSGAEGVRVRRTGKADQGQFIVSLNVKGAASWLIVHIHQSRDAVVEKFGLALERDEPEVMLTVRLEPLPTDELALAYIASHVDLISALGASAAAGRDHYRRFGVKEKRAMYFRPYDYAASHEDLRRLMPNAAALAEHYITQGCGEGRVTTFDSLVYGASYPDLAKQFGANEKALAEHYMKYGAAEGRRIDGFDWRAYAGDTPGAPYSPREAAKHYLASVRS